MGNEASTEQTALPGFSHDVAAWLMDAALSEDSVESIIAGTCARLHALGLPLLRGHVSFRTLHPLFHAIGLTWEIPMFVLSAERAKIFSAIFIDLFHIL